MYIGYQGNKIKFYVSEPLSPVFYPVDKWEETDQEYVPDGDTYVVKTAEWEEEQKRKEQERINMLSLTRREVFLALLEDKGIMPEQLRAQIQDPKALIEFDYASEYFRGNPLINSVGLLLGYTSQDLDYLFEYKRFPVHE